jgi:NADH:ubiquinone oxidoreductase subunit F (NADH-binding)
MLYLAFIMYVVESIEDVVPCTVHAAMQLHSNACGNCCNCSSATTRQQQMTQQMTQDM